MAPKSKDGSLASPARRSKSARTPASPAVVEACAEIDAILGKDLPECAKNFVAQYAEITEQGWLEAQPGPAKHLAQAAQHLNAASWRRGMTARQAAELQVLMSEVLPAMQALLTVAASCNVRAALSRGEDPAAVLGALRLALEVSALYCELTSIYGAPATLVVEEVNLGVVQCLKMCVRQLLTPLLSSMENSAKNSIEPLPFGKDEIAYLCQLVSAAMSAVHELLCRHKFPDDQLHQLVYVCVNVFFLSEVDFRLCAAAEELLVTIFCRHPGMQSSVVQEFLVGVTKLPTGKYAKKFLLQVPQDNPDCGLSTWTHLLLRLMQSTCLPLGEPLGGKIDFEQVLHCRATAQAALNQLTGGLIQRLLLTRSRDDELRGICSDLTEELLVACLKPSWPGALALLRTLFYQLVSLVQQGRKKEAADASIREFALKIISKIICHLTHHQVEAEKDAIKLPSWSLPQNKVNKDYRMLQHVALRVSLEDGRKLPWTAAAKAVQAWDAELYLKNEDNSGLSSFTDDIVFRYLIMAHLEDERLVPSKCPPTSAGKLTLSSAVFGAAHPIHAWTFLVCDWAESATRSRKQAEAKEEENGEVDVEASNQQRVLERLLSVAWTSPTVLSGEGGSSRSGGGRRVLLPFIVHKVFRQLQCSAPIEGILKLGIDCMVMQANSQQATLRRTAVKCLGEVIEIDSRMLTQKAVEETLDMRIRDESAWVRQAALDLLGRLLDTSDADDEDAVALMPSGDDTTSAILLRFQQTVRTRINDTSLLVRRQASKILGAFVLTHPDHADVVPVVLDLLHRSTDSDKLRDMVLQTFEILWFADENPATAGAMQLARVVAAASTANTDPVSILTELLGRFKKNLSTKKRTKGYEEAIRRWTHLLLREFVRLSGARAPELLLEEEIHLERSAVLSTLEAFAVVQPKEMLLQLRPLTVYLCLEDNATADEQWVAQKVCRIISAVLPCPVDKRGIFAHASVQNDLQSLIKTSTSSGVREAVRCLCLIVKHMTGDLAQVVRHIIEAIPALNHYCDLATSHPEKIDRLALMYMSRLTWVMCSILETLPIDTYMEPQGTRLQRAVFPFPLEDESVAKTVLVTLAKLYAVPHAALKAVVVQGLGFFLCGHRAYMKERSVGHTLALSLTNTDMTIRLRALETMSRLLGHYGREAENEIQLKGTAQTVTSAVESAQPLAMHLQEVLVHITVAKTEIGRLIVHRGGQDEELLLKVRIEALTVLRYLHQQGLVNPMTILAKVFALAFAVELPVAEPASLLLKDMLEMRPSILLNRLDEALHDAFLAALAGSQPPTLGEALRTPFATLCQLYADISRRTKSTREMLIRKLLQQILRLNASRFREVFSDLLECSEHPAMTFKKRRLLVTSLSEAGDFTSSMLSRLPALQYYQLLYAQFVASVLTALPFQYESEPLLVIYECNRHLALIGGPLSAAGEGNDPEALNDLLKDYTKDHFAEAVSVVTCLVLKSTMKAEYGITVDQCVQFNPKEPKQEKIKTGFFNLTRRGGEDAKGGEEGPSTQRIAVFPFEDWSPLAAPLAAKYEKPYEIAKLVQEAMDSDPWDSSFSRYANKVDQLEGKAPKKKEPKTPRSGRGGRSGTASGRGRGARGRGAKRRKTEAAGEEEEDADLRQIFSDVDDSADEDYVPR